jgi:hypothetical protein
VVALRIPQAALVALVEGKPGLLREMEEVRIRYRTEERALLDAPAPGEAASPNGHETAAAAP